MNGARQAVTHRWVQVFAVVMAAAPACGEGTSDRLAAGDARVLDVSGSDGAISDATSSGRAAIHVSPVHIVFGLTSTLAPSRRSVIITNVGFEPLEVLDAYLDSDAIESGFTVVAPNDDWRSRRMQPGASILLEIEYSGRNPDGAHQEGRLVVESDDPDRPLLTVRLLAQSLHCCDCKWSIEQTVIDFGLISPSTRVLRTTQVSNDDDRYGCEIRGVARGGCSASLHWESNLPRRLGPGMSSLFEVSFQPEATGEHACTIDLRTSHIYSDTTTVELRGTAR